MHDPGSPSLTSSLDADELRARGVRACCGQGPIVLEIGFGRGEALIEMARAAPDRTFLGVEVSRKRALKGARRVDWAEVPNVRIVCSTAEYLLERVLPDGSIAECWVNFPDPWPKKRHHKRRLIRPELVRRIVRVLEPGALLHIATDHAAYATWIAEVMREAPGLRNLHAPDSCSRAQPCRPETGYEAEFLAEGRIISYFEYRTGPAPERVSGGPLR